MPEARLEGAAPEEAHAGEVLPVRKSLKWERTLAVPVSTRRLKLQRSGNYEEEGVKRLSK